MTNDFRYLFLRKVEVWSLLSNSIHVKFPFRYLRIVPRSVLIRLVSSCGCLDLINKRQRSMLEVVFSGMLVACFQFGEFFLVERGYGVQLVRSESLLRCHEGRRLEVVNDWVWVV